MTNEEIKKGLEICADNYNHNSCCGCPYNSVRHCNDALENDARELIIKQEQEIAQLKADNVRLITKLGQVLLSIDTVKEMNVMCNIEAQVKQAKIDVLNELKKKKSIAVWDIDEMIAEYENEG